MNVIVTCPCGKDFETHQSPSREGRGRFCGKPCFYAYRKPRPHGLTYQIKAQNRGWFERGRAERKNSDSPYWKGDAVHYKSLHKWVAREKGPRPNACSACGQMAKTQWANLSHEYRRDLSDWAAMCQLCHRRYDKAAWGAASARFGVGQVQRGL